MFRNIRCDCSASQFPGSQQGVRPGLGTGGDHPRVIAISAISPYVFPQNRSQHKPGVAGGARRESVGLCRMYQGRAPIATINDHSEPVALARKVEVCASWVLPQAQRALGQK